MRTGLVESIFAFITTAVLVVLLPASAFAQQLGGGVKAGIAYGDIPNKADAEYRVGGAAGGFLILRFTNGLAIQSEVLYTQKGVITGDGQRLTLKAGFLDIPVLGRVTLRKGARVYLFAGPSFDFNLGAEASVQGRDLLVDLKAIEVAVVFGGGLELGPILVEGRWSEGLTDLQAQVPQVPRPPYSGAGGTTTLKTRTILLLGGLRF